MRESVRSGGRVLAGDEGAVWERGVPGLLGLEAKADEEAEVEVGLGVEGGTGTLWLYSERSRTSDGEAGPGTGRSFRRRRWEGLEAAAAKRSSGEGVLAVVKMYGEGRTYASSLAYLEPRGRTSQPTPDRPFRF
jgi:hypothetical protein